MKARCENCLYGHLCCPERMIACTDFEDKRLWLKFSWQPGETAYIVFAEQVHKVKVTLVSYQYSKTLDKPVIKEVVFYNFYGETLHYDPLSKHHCNPLFRDRRDAEKALERSNENAE